MACAAEPMTRASSSPGPTRAFRVMGGEQAALGAGNGPPRCGQMDGGGSRSLQGPDPPEIRGRRAIRYYATARLWDDGVIDPVQTRDVLGLALGVCLENPITGGAPVWGVPDVTGLSPSVSASRCHLPKASSGRDLTLSSFLPSLSRGGGPPAGWWRGRRSMQAEAMP